MFSSPATFGKAKPGYAWKFPNDHGAHPAYRTEWWYYTGFLTDETGESYGFQLTFFRTGLKTAPETRSSFEPTSIYFAHFAVSDLAQKTFDYAEKTGRPGPGLAGAAEGKLKVWDEDWSATYEPPGHRLRASDDKYQLDLKVASGVAPVLHGQRGYSPKGEGQASEYYSLTRMAAVGTLTINQVPRKVNGISWMDHEFFTGDLPKDLKGWDWMGLTLSDGAQLMLYRMREKDGTVGTFSSGTLVEANGKQRALGERDFTMEPLQSWTSPRTKVAYPIRWRVTVPSVDLSFEASAPLADQELDTAKSTQVLYWEGPVFLKGTRGKRNVTGKGYLEMTGYDQAFGGF